MSVKRLYQNPEIRPYIPFIIGVSGIAISTAIYAGYLEYNKVTPLEEIMEPCLYELYQRDLARCHAKISDEKTKLLFQLGAEVKDICFPKDTEKPNALLIYPLSDREGSFYNQSEYTFVNKIKSVYDTSIVIAESYYDVNSTLYSAKNIDLLVISGHGGEDGIRLGSKQSYSYVLDSSLLYDYKLDNNALDYMLTENGTVFLNSCQQGTYFDFYFHSDNKRTVISSYLDFNINQVQVSSWYPLKLKIIVDDKDATKIELR